MQRLVRPLTVVLLLIVLMLSFSPQATLTNTLAAGKTPTPKKITICHVPPGNPANAHTITIASSAWRTDGRGQGGHGPGRHGGDYAGACRPKSSATSTTSIPPTATLVPTTIPTNTPTDTPTDTPTNTPTNTPTDTPTDT